MANKLTSLMVRLDQASKDYLVKAAALRRLSISDYVRIVTLGQARQEVDHAASNTIALTQAEQVQFWKALSDPPALTKAQRRLGRTMRGED